MVTRRAETRTSWADDASAGPGRATAVTATRHHVAHVGPMATDGIEIRDARAFGSAVCVVLVSTLRLYGSLALFVPAAEFGVRDTTSRASVF